MAPLLVAVDAWEVRRPEQKEQVEAVLGGEAPSPCPTSPPTTSPLPVPSMCRPTAARLSWREAGGRPPRPDSMKPIVPVPGTPLARFVARMVMAAGAHPAGSEVATFLACRRRPGRRPCRGRLVLRRQEVPPTVDWSCPRCGDSGVLSFEKGFPEHLLRSPVPPEAQREVVLTADEYRAALGACESPETEAVILSAVARGDQASLRLADSELVLLSAELLGVLTFGKPGRARRHLEQVVRKLGVVTPSPASALLPLQEPTPRRRRRRAARSSRGARTMHQLKVTLQGIRPPIWRRLLVPSDITLDRLHAAIQGAMGWFDCHLHEFECDGRRFGQPDPDDFELVEDESRFTLTRLAPRAGDRLRYCYDFGDNWQHEIRVEKVLPRDPGLALPACTAGRRACPPEDCGGPWGYAELLQALADPKHPEHADLMEWTDGGFDPACFDLDETQSRLRGWLELPG